MSMTRLPAQRRSGALRADSGAQFALVGPRHSLRAVGVAQRLTPADHPALVAAGERMQAWRLYGALFFGATKLVEEIEDHLPPHTLVLDLKNVIYVDSTGAEALENLVHTCRQQGVRLIVSGLMNQPLDIARRTGLLTQLTQNSADDVQPDVAHAIDAALAGLPAAPEGDEQMAYSGA